MPHSTTRPAPGATQPTASRSCRDTAYDITCLRWACATVCMYVMTSPTGSRKPLPWLPPKPWQQTGWPRHCACEKVWYGMVWYGMVWYGIVWYGMVGYGRVGYGMVWYRRGPSRAMVASLRHLCCIGGQGGDRRAMVASLKHPCCIAVLCAVVPTHHPHHSMFHSVQLRPAHQPPHHTMRCIEYHRTECQCLHM